ncbi:iron-containing redox enzyme family protein [Streptomyces corynorhini]|uniref:Iron-containing redox enzyme family protein n=1 Tax=Streptomyces corynorhini TaxID=2282652 RepID=A0A370B710_9ACTN|nr:iron-containing redox enzyme family protein [Streptomyces corynorhini]RDG35633.1 iron-containing redox enzyme family protein [Streptomyces corynorhini]
MTAVARVAETSEHDIAPLPAPRGVVTEALVDALKGEPGPFPIPGVAASDPLADDDLHLALYVCYELHYRGFAGVDDRWEWHPSVLDLRGRLEREFETALRERFGVGEAPADGDAVAALKGIAAQPGPPLSRYLRDEATLEQLRDYLIHRSLYQLKEADPHAWAIPRMTGRAKAGLLEVEFDEFGSGRAERIHAVLYRNSMDAMGLDIGYGAYLDAVPGLVLATVNISSMFGLHRRMRAALAGHLAISEMTSALANKNAADGMRRLGLGDRVTEFFDEHVTADSVHDVIALHDMVGGLLEQDPGAAREVLFGATAWTGIDALSSEYLLDRWRKDEPSLRPDHLGGARP